MNDDQHEGLLADLVMIDPPCGELDPPLERWIEFGLRHRAQDGSLTVLLPANRLAAVPSARRRPDAGLQELVRVLASDYAITTAIVMPRNLRTDVVGPLVLLHIGPATERSGIRLISIATRHLDDFERVAKRLSRRLMEPSFEGQYQWASTDDFMKRAVNDTVVDPKAFFVALEGAIDDVERVSSRPGAPRKSKRGTDAESNLDEGELFVASEMRSEPVALYSAPRRSRSHDDPLVKAALELLRTLESSSGLIPDSLQQRLSKPMQSVRDSIE